MTRNQILSFFFLALIIFIVYQILLIFSPFLSAIFWAAIFVFAFLPLYSYLKRTLKFPETVTAILMTAFIFFVVIVPLIWVGVYLVKESVELYGLAVSYVREGGVEKLMDNVRSFLTSRNLTNQMIQWEPLKENAASWLIQSSRAIGLFATDQAATLSKNVLLFLLNIFIATLFIFIFLKDGPKIYAFLYEIVPLEPGNKEVVFKRINETMGAVIRGQLFTALVQATVAGIIFWALQIPVPLFYAMVTFLMSLIPIAGSAVVWFPLAMYLFMQHEYIRGGILIFLGICVISLIDNVMKPILIGERTKLPYFLLFFGILGGLKLYGLMGIFLAPVVLSLFFVLIQIFQQKFQS